MTLCAITKVVCSEALDIVGIATETGIKTEPRSEDGLSLDARHWTEELEARARAAQERTGLLTNLTKFQDKIAEFQSRASNSSKCGDRILVEVGNPAASRWAPGHRKRRMALLLASRSATLPPFPRTQPAAAHC